MAEIETLGILDEIQYIVSDKLQVVSYKWLSRNFLVSSDAAKRLLQEFVEKYGNGLEVIYTLSGWLKNNPSTYHIKLVSKNKLSDAKHEFNGDCSIQVYSVQASLPKDPATLWNQEFVQAEDLFKQPQTADNCLRDNRFCGVSNSFVKRVSGEASSGSRPNQIKTEGASDLSKSYSTQTAETVPQPLQKKVQQSSPNVSGIGNNVKPDVKLEHGKGSQNKEKISPSLPNNQKGQTEKKPSGTGNSLANIWGRASAKSKPDTPLAQADNSKANSIASAEGQICARESAECGSSDEEDRDFTVHRASNAEGSRKRRVVFDYSDEEDEYQNAVNLASPDPPKRSTPRSDSLKTSGLENSLGFEENENKPMINRTNEDDAGAIQPLGEKVSAANKDKQAKPPTSEKATSHVPKIEANVKDTAADAVPKRRKVLKKRIDERGREVTEVVWEGEEPDRNTISNSSKTSDTSSASNTIHRPPVARKSPAIGIGAPANPSGKGGNKKGGNKDPKQGNILSFFKKV
ncbi:uncharacterized protein LOC127248133 [Andrographis paniculata]|uniref:uncharacterized protein LOC127248133 n=1 Tax=Andrographis paniculata TaxID=175694 RepID=UPI0021E8B3AC|nr:uncharacterized protein LOC127248133 [Andrographis paniculata]